MSQKWNMYWNKRAFLYSEMWRPKLKISHVTKGKGAPIMSYKLLRCKSNTRRVVRRQETCIDAQSNAEKLAQPRLFREK